MPILARNRLSGSIQVFKVTIEVTAMQVHVSHAEESASRPSLEMLKRMSIVKNGSTMPANKNPVGIDDVC